MNDKRCAAVSDWNEFAARNTARAAADRAEEQERDQLRADLDAATQRVEALAASAEQLDRWRAEVEIIKNANVYSDGFLEYSVRAWREMIPALLAEVESLRAEFDAATARTEKAVAKLDRIDTVLTRYLSGYTMQEVAQGRDLADREELERLCDIR